MELAVSDGNDLNSSTFSENDNGFTQNFSPRFSVANSAMICGSFE
jgi:hypothetical protein